MCLCVSSQHREGSAPPAPSHSWLKYLLGERGRGGGVRSQASDACWGWDNHAVPLWPCLMPCRRFQGPSLGASERLFLPPTALTVGWSSSPRAVIGALDRTRLSLSLSKKEHRIDCRTNTRAAASGTNKWGRSQVSLSYPPLNRQTIPDKRTSPWPPSLFLTVMKFVCFTTDLLLPICASAAITVSF